MWYQIGDKAKPYEKMIGKEINYNLALEEKTDILKLLPTTAKKLLQQLNERLKKEKASFPDPNPKDVNE